MSTKSKLRNTSVKKIQQLSADKLFKASHILNEMWGIHISKKNNLKFAGSWKDIDSDFFNDMTADLHYNRIASSE